MLKGRVKSEVGPYWPWRICSEFCYFQLHFPMPFQKICSSSWQLSLWMVMGLFFFHPPLIFNNKFPCCGFCLLPLDYMPPRKESCPCLLWCNSLDKSFWAKQGLPSIIGLSDCHSAFKIFQLVVSVGKCPFPMTGECPMVILHRLNAIQPAILCVTRDKKPHKKHPMKHSPDSENIRNQKNENNFKKS